MKIPLISKMFFSIGIFFSNVAIKIYIGIKPFTFESFIFTSIALLITFYMWKEEIIKLYNLIQN